MSIWKTQKIRRLKYWSHRDFGYKECLYLSSSLLELEEISSRCWSSQGTLNIIRMYFCTTEVLIKLSNHFLYSRRRMRCTTTIYLTALAVADIVYLLFVLMLSFEHYPNIHDKKYELFWRFYGISHWICDAASKIIFAN